MLQGLAGAGRAGKAEVTLNRAEQPGQAGINTALELAWKHLWRGTAAFHRAGAAKIQRVEHRAVPVPPGPLATSHSRLSSREKWQFSPWGGSAGFFHAAKAWLMCWRFGPGELWVGGGCWAGTPGR